MLYAARIVASETLHVLLEIRHNYELIKIPGLNDLKEADKHGTVM